VVRLWFWLCLRQVSRLRNFCLFFQLFSWCFWQPSRDSGTRAPRAYPESSVTICIRERGLVCFVYLCHHPRSHFTKLLTRAVFFGPCHCSYIFVPCLAFRVHVGGDLNKTISFVVGVLSTLFSLLGLIHQSPSCPRQISIFENIIHIRLNVFEVRDLYWTLELKSDPMEFPFRE